MNIYRKYVFIGLLMFFIGAAYAIDGNSSNTDTIPSYPQKQLVNRFGKKAASNIMQNKIEPGYSHSMVILAKGRPYLIEEPLGKYMDFEIFYYNDCAVFFEYGIVTHIKPTGTRHN